VADAIAARDRVATRYWDGLAQIEGLRCLCPPGQPGHNSYAFPVLVGDAYPISRDGLYERLARDGIRARRYFFPLISDMPMYRDLPSADPLGLTVSRRSAAQVLCLPLYPDLDPEDQDRVIEIVRNP
jgi:dTDP-4-amino-4,6-dideoxygalactose transaminase